MTRPAFRTANQLLSSFSWCWGAELHQQVFGWWLGHQLQVLI